jgi:hypothetical protein
VVAAVVTVLPGCITYYRKQVADVVQSTIHLNSVMIKYSAFWCLTVVDYLMLSSNIK